MLQGGEVGGGVIGSEPASVVSEDHLHDPVQAVLHGPVVSDKGSHLAGRHAQRGDVEAGLMLDFAAEFAAAVDHDYAFQAGPSMAFLQPGDIVDDGDGPGPMRP